MQSTQRWLPPRGPSSRVPRLKLLGSTTTKTHTRVCTLKAVPPTWMPIVVSTDSLTDLMRMCVELRLALVWPLSPTRSLASKSATKRRRRVQQLPPRKRRRQQQALPQLPLHQVAQQAACKKSSLSSPMAPRWTARLSLR